MTSTAPQETPSTISTPAVLYICAERAGTSTLATERATEEGHAFAQKHALRIVTTITDLYGEPVPQKRGGWMRVRQMAERGEVEVEVAIVRWPNALSPHHELRYPELDHLRQHSCQILFSWAPLAVMVGAGATR
ncbi:hypothetical protein AB0D04_15320 [Streptomyces sp. NPDC048483]|uniref:hypothetical protein n=1 Tax=Streptomyces sp. NPDC048483 TaxID=3154927 RepID=UPI0034320E6D